MRFRLFFFPLLGFFVLAGGPSAELFAQSSGSETETAELRAEREFYELLMMLDGFAADAPPASDLEPFAAELQIDFEENPEAERIDDRWLLSLLAILDEESAVEAERAMTLLAAIAEQLADASERSTGQLQAAIDASSGDVQRLIELATLQQSIDPRATRLAIGEAQRVLALFHCRQANREAAGSLANPVPSMQQRLVDLTAAARLMVAASQAVNYRIPAEAKRTLASSLAMSKLFSQGDVRVSQVRERAREMETALNELGGAIRRAAP